MADFVSERLSRTANLVHSLLCIRKSRGADYTHDHNGYESYVTISQDIVSSAVCGVHGDLALAASLSLLQPEQSINVADEPAEVVG